MGRTRPRLLDQAAEAYLAYMRRSFRPPGQRAALRSLATPLRQLTEHGAGRGDRVEDALVLAEMLTAEQPVDQAPARYEQGRGARAAWVQDQTHRRDRTRNLAATVRNVTLRLAGERIFRSNYRPLRALP